MRHYLNLHIGSELLFVNLLCTPCPKGNFSLAGKACGSCASGSYPTPDKTGCLPCDTGKYANSIFIGDLSQCTACAQGSYSEVSGLDSREKCVKCPPGTHSSVKGANSNATCVDCPAGRFADEYGLSSCASCDEDGFYCEKGATKRTECDRDKFDCRGATRKERSDALASWTPMFDSFGLDGLNVSLPGNESYSYRIELRRASKEGQLTVANDSERGAKSVTITDLDMG
jgi:hypothetical protein